MKKKMLALFLATSMLAGLAGCGGSAEPAADAGADATAKTETADTKAEASDAKTEEADAGTDAAAIDALYAEYDKIKIDYPYGQFVPDVNNIQSYINNINDVHNTYMKQISFGLYQGTAEEIVAEYQEALKGAGIETVQQELQRQFDELYK